MQVMNDMELLIEYATNGSEAAFETLVQRHVNLVYSAAFRQVHDPMLSGEVTQTVFIILARKAATLPRGTILAGWLYRTAQFAASRALRAELRRRNYEQEAARMNSGQSEHIWDQIAPFLDEGMARLGDADRNAVVLRYFENKNLKEVGAAFGSNERAAQKRVARAVEKLRSFFVKRGLVLPVAVVTAVLSAHAVQAAPIGMAKAASSVALAKGTAAASGSTVALIKGTLKLMAWTKAKTTAVAVVVAILGVGTTTLTVKEIHKYKNANWQVEFFDLKKAPPLVRIVPTKFLKGGLSGEAVLARTVDDKMWGLNVDLASIVANAYGDSEQAVSDRAVNRRRMLLVTALPQGGFDFIASLPSGQSSALQQLIMKQFGIAARSESVETNVLFLKVKFAGAPGLELGHSGLTQFVVRQPVLSVSNQAGMSRLAHWLERKLEIPVVDQTGLTNFYNYHLKWASNDPYHLTFESLRQALIDQLGLDLIPGRGPVEMLLVEKGQ